MFLRTFIFLTSLLSCYSKSVLPSGFDSPTCEQLDYVNPLIGNGGDTPNGSGGMIPSTAPPFAMTRWVAQTHENYVSVAPYNYTAERIHGFQATHQPAIWMGESGNVAVIPGVGSIPNVEFASRGMKFLDRESTEIISPSYYSTTLELDEQEGGTVKVEQSATSRVGHLRFCFQPATHQNPYIAVEASRPSVITSTPTNITYPSGSLVLSPETNEICGSNSEIQDFIIAPTSIKDTVQYFKGYFCARFNTKGSRWGIIQNGTVLPENIKEAEGPLLSAFVYFPREADEIVVDVRIGVSFISIAQARQNLDREIPDGTTLEQTAAGTRTKWVEKMGRVEVGGAAATEADKEVFYTAVFHSLQYPYEQHEYGRYYSAYDNKVHEGESYTGYSIWSGMGMAYSHGPGKSTQYDHEYAARLSAGWLPMWKNIFETNIMVGTHADSLIAEAVLKGITDFDLGLAWEAVYKDAMVAPEGDDHTVYDDREENVDYEVRAGLDSVYSTKGWVADDVHSESASRTLDYAYDDYAVFVLARELNKPATLTDLFHQRSLRNPFTIFNQETGFMEARKGSGGWAGPDRGWTEGDMWAYSFDVVHDIPELIKRRGGKESFINSLDEHFEGGHNDHTNEPSHHIPYLYSMAGAAHKAQDRIRLIAKSDYNNTARGLSGNEDCGQMSAWYIFSAMGFYPVNPLSGEYIVGTPLFDTLTFHFPKFDKPLVISAPGASSAKPYVHGVKVNGVPLDSPVILHEQLTAKGGVNIDYQMGNEPGQWGNEEWDDGDDLEVERSEL